jgi:AmiR/NasT family two-component response regulator
MLRNSKQAGVSALLVRPLQARDLTPWIDQL